MKYTEKKALIIAYWYNTENAASGQVQRHFIKNLPKWGISPTIIYAGDSSDEFRDGIRSIGISPNKILRLFLKTLSKTALSSYLRLPDITRFFWNYKVIKKLRLLFKEGQFDYIHTINNPSSSHLIGLKVKQLYNIPWVAQFYDPWTNNPVEPYINSRIKEYNHTLEEKVAIHADVILHTNDLIISYWKDLYLKTVNRKIYRLNLLTDIEPIDRTNHNRKFIISHIGHFTEYRNSITFIEAVQHINLMKPSLLEKLEINFIGLVTEKEKDLIQRYGLTNIFKLHGRLSEKDCIPYFEKSTFFLIVDTNHNPNYFFPSKILKYFFYKRPILGITAQESVLKEELIQSNNIYFEYNEVIKIADFLISQLESEIFYDKQDTEYWREFSPQVIISRYRKIIDQDITSL